MINIRKRGNVYQYGFEVGKVNGKRKQITKSGFRTKNEAFAAGQRAYEEFISGESTKECNMLYSEYLDYWMREYFEINYKYSTAKRYKESFGNIKRELGNYKLSAITSFCLNQALLRLYQTSTTKEALRNYQKVIICFAHCQYCFRTYNLSKFQQSNLKETIKNKISVLKKYLQSHLNIREVIFSGGDPLSIGYENMKFALDELKEWDIRIHTRAIAYEPSIFTKKMIDLLNEHNVRLVFHINHPYEIDEVVEEKINEIRKAGIRMYSQFPLLRGINDNSKVLIKLLIKMDELNIRPLSIFIPDPISYGAVNRISVSRIEKIMDEVNWNTPSWVNSTRFVMDTTIGKVRRENIIKREGKCITFSRDGKTVDYYDLDDGIDVPSPIDKLLWKN